VFSENLSDLFRDGLFTSMKSVYRVGKANDEHDKTYVKVIGRQSQYRRSSAREADTQQSRVRLRCKAGEDLRQSRNLRGEIISKTSERRGRKRTYERHPVWLVNFVFHRFVDKPRIGWTSRKSRREHCKSLKVEHLSQLISTKAERIKTKVRTRSFRLYCSGKTPLAFAVANSNLGITATALISFAQPNRT
jgi:hypothetical protein